MALRSFCIGQAKLRSIEFYCQDVLLMKIAKRGKSCLWYIKSVTFESLPFLGSI